MTDPVSEKQMIIETYITVKKLEEQTSRHRIEDRQNQAQLWTEIKGIKEKHVELSEEHGERLTILETDHKAASNIFSKVAAWIALLLGATSLADRFLNMGKHP